MLGGIVHYSVLKGPAGRYVELIGEIHNKKHIKTRTFADIVQHMNVDCPGTDIFVEMEKYLPYTKKAMVVRVLSC